jgi:hypothetical protein
MARLDCSFLGRPLEKFGKVFNYIMLREDLFISRGKKRDSSTPEYGWSTSGVQAEYRRSTVEYKRST